MTGEYEEDFDLCHTEDRIGTWKPSDPHYNCPCHEAEVNDFCGPAYCKRPGGCINLTAEPAFDAKWWFENEMERDGTRRVKAVVTTYRVGDVSVSTRVEFE